MLNDTTRCYPRTLQEAFDSREWLEHYPNHGAKLADKAVGLTLLVCVIVLILVVALESAP